MASPIRPKSFLPLTKYYAATSLHMPNTDDICGVLAVTMLLNWCGVTVTAPQLLEQMQQVRAYQPGVGTYLSRVRSVGLDGRQWYARVLPTMLLRFLVTHGYGVAASVRLPGGGSHIVFVCGADATGICYFDPNTSDTLQVLRYPEWQKISNRRGLIMKAHL